MERGCFESYNGRRLDELLDRKVFYKLQDVGVLAAQWRQTCNRVGSQSPLGWRPPVPGTVLPADPLPVLFN